MTLWFSILGGRRDADEQIAALNERLAQRSQRTRGRQTRERPAHERPARERPARERPALVIAQVDAAHLGERLGLFVIIVLGEAMLQLVGSMAEVEDWAPRSPRRESTCPPPRRGCWAPAPSATCW